MKGWATLAIFALATGTTSFAAADGGTLRARRSEGPLTLSLLIAPTPTRAGTVEASVFVQHRDSGKPVRVPVEIAWWPEAHRERIAIASARPGRGANRLLLGAQIDIPSPGSWVVEARAATARLRYELDVAPARPALGSYWMALLIPPLGVALLALHEGLRRRQSAPRPPF